MPGSGLLEYRWVHLLLPPVNTTIVVSGKSEGFHECKESAEDKDAGKRSLATRFAHGILPQVFRPNLPSSTDWPVQ